MLPLGWNPAWVSCLREGRAGAAAGCRLALGSVRVRGQQRPRSAPHSVFGCINQAPRAGTPRTFCAGSAAVVPFVRPAAALPRRSGPVCGALSVPPCPGQGAGHCGMCPAGNTPCPGPGTGACSQPAFNGEMGIGIQPDLAGVWDTHKLPLNTKLILCPSAARRRVRHPLWGHFCFGQPGALGRARRGPAAVGHGALPAPHTKRQSLGCVCVTRPAPSPSRWSCQCDNAVQCCYRSHTSVVNVNGRNMVNMDTFSFQM